jgi:hypothetical protein
MKIGGIKLVLWAHLSSWWNDNTYENTDGQQ